MVDGEVISRTDLPDFQDITILHRVTLKVEGDNKGNAPVSIYSQLGFSFYTLDLQ
jgi:hypothetical protein